MLTRVTIRAALAVFLLFVPMIAGLILSQADIQPFGFIFLAVYPQVFIFFPIGYRSLNFVFDITVSLAFWSGLIFISLLLTRRLHVFIFIITLVALSIASVLLAHTILGGMGYSYSIYPIKNI